MSNLESIGAVAKLLTFFFDRDAIDSARTKVALDSAERYMMVNEGDSPYDSFDENKKKKYLKHYRKRFISYNN